MLNITEDYRHSFPLDNLDIGQEQKKIKKNTYLDLIFRDHIPISVLKAQVFVRSRVSKVVLKIFPENASFFSYENNLKNFP